MNFKFKVNVSEQDYLDYNLFWLSKSPYGKNAKVVIILMMERENKCFTMKKRLFL